MAQLFYLDTTKGIPTWESAEVKPNNGTDFSLEELQGFVEGYIEIHELKDNKYIVCNEEGKLHDLPYNPLASAMYWLTYGRTDVIVGNALVCDKGEIK